MRVLKDENNQKEIEIMIITFCGKGLGKFNYMYNILQ